MTLFRWLGAGHVLLAAFCFAVFRLSRQGAWIRAAELRPFWVLGAFLLILGIGLLLKQRWAGGVFCVCGFVFSVWLIGGSLMAVPFPWVLVNLLYGGVVFWASTAVLRALLRSFRPRAGAGLP